jgi:hypothetical protein
VSEHRVVWHCMPAKTPGRCEACGKPYEARDPVALILGSAGRLMVYHEPCARATLTPDGERS